MYRKCKDADNDGLKKYISYVFLRPMMIEVGIIRVSDNEEFYYEALRDKLNDYFKRHRLFYDYLVGKKTVDYLRTVINKDLFPKWRKRERACLISYITEWEFRLFAEFPFTDRKKSA